jgi:Tol biopolymer transport system component
MNMKKALWTALIVIGLAVIGYGQEKQVEPAKPAEPASQTNPAAPAAQIPGPAFKDVLSLKSVGSPVISPDGKDILFTVTQADWDKNRYDTEIWLSRDGAAPFQLTQTTDESSDSPTWSPDGKKIAFDHRPDPLINSGPKSDISILDIESQKITPLVTQPGSDGGPQWSPDGQWIAFSTSMGDDRYYVNGKIA